MSFRLMAATVLATVAVLALVVGRAHADGPLPPGACETHGAAGLIYETGVNCRTVEVDGHPRRYVVYVPERRLPASPVVLMFHGTGGDGEQFLRISGWREQADRTGLIAVFPTGLRYRVEESGLLKTKWHDFDLEEDITDERPPGYPEDAPMPADDVGFVDRILADLDSRLPIDRRRIYASGFSNGAGFSARLSVDRSTRIAAVAYSGGGLGEEQVPERPVPAYVTVGTSDDHALEDTGLAELPLDPIEILSSPVIAPLLDVRLAALGLDPDLYGAIAETRSTLLRWPAQGTGERGALLQFRMIARLEHRYPNGDNNPAGFEAAPEFWDFFREHPLP
jgi:poly(3-hydroxybutyrate) depolymerase